MSAPRCGILAAGTLLVDHVQLIDDWPEQGRLATILHTENATGGAVPNVLRTLARMKTGLPLAAAGLLGDDRDGEFIRQCLSDDDIDCHWLQTAPLPTSMTQVMTNHRNGQRTFFHAHGCNAAFDAPLLANLNSTHKIVHLAYLLLLQKLEAVDNEYGVVAARLFHELQQQSYLTSLDLVSIDDPERAKRVVLPTLPYVDYLIINELEAATLTGQPLRMADGKPDLIQIPHAAKTLLQQGVKQVVVIHCPEGAWAANRQGESLFMPSYWIAPQDIAGTVGAGDAFCAGVLYSLHQEWDLHDTLQLGNACARVNLRSTNAIDGAAPLTELQAFIAQQANGNGGDQAL
jgi:sugar/nucleoside kinase (ribokinase family)